MNDEYDRMSEAQMTPYGYKPPKKQPRKRRRKPQPCKRCAEAAAFLDVAARWPELWKQHAADCRAVAARLRGSAEPVAVQPEQPSRKQHQG